MATDTFRFSWWNDGSLRPQGGTNWNGGVIVCSKDSNGNCITDENNNDIMEENARDIVGGAEYWQTQCAKDAIPTNPEYCAGHIFENNLKVLYK